MKKFDGILFCTDLDGTLLRHDKSISRENLEAIEYFKSEGGIFTFVTGRMPYFVADIYNTVNPNAPFGCINGGGLYDHRSGEYIWTRTLPHDALELVAYADENIAGIGIQVNTFEKIYFSRENSAMALFRTLTNSPNIVRHYNDVEEPIAKIVFGDENERSIERLAELLNSHPKAHEFDFIRSEQTLYEILPKNITKGMAVEKLREYFGVSVKKTIAVGDYNNDIGMLRQADLGIAVANATPETKSVADYITVSNEEHAIAKIISELESGILKL